VSKWPREKLENTLEICRNYGFELPVANQDVYNLYTRDVEVNFDSLYGETGLGFLAYSPLARGVLTGKYSEGIPEKSRASNEEFIKMMYDFNDKKIDQAKQLSELATRNGQSPASLALAYLLSHQHVSSVIIGATSVEQLKDNLAAVETKYNADLIAEAIKIFN